MEFTEEKKETSFGGEKTIQLVKQLIRYDIPFIMLGISSIGKSYSIIDMASRWRMPNSILYIGSEKPSNIEGLPRLVGQRSETGDILEFFKPNWFPNTFLISEYVTNGKKVFERFVNTAYKGNKKEALDGTSFDAMNEVFEGIFQWKWPSNTSEKGDMILAKVGTKKDVLNTTFKVSRDLLDEKAIFENTSADPNFIQEDEVRDMSLYLSTILGYGNYWLILDELDKVDEAEQDKYAPLLHIVRERIIKSFSMRTLNEGEGAGVPMKVKSGSYKNIKESIDDSIKNGFPLLDTRIIGIANATFNIEPALFRRFLHIIIEGEMMVSAPPIQLMKLRNCLKSVNETDYTGTGINPFSELDFKLLEEVNLQWQFSFFPRLINEDDSRNNFIIDNLNKTISLAGINDLTKGFGIDFSATSNMLFRKASDSALFKIIRNNFGIDNDMDSSPSTDFQTLIYGCLVSEARQGGGAVENIIQGKVDSSTPKDENEEIIEEALGLSPDDPMEAAKYIIANNLMQFSEMEKSNASILKYVRETIDLVEAGKNTSIQDELFTGLLANVYSGVMFSEQTIDFKLVTSTYINQFNSIAQENGFIWLPSSSSFTKQALKVLELQQDTLELTREGSAEGIAKFNKEMSDNAFLIYKQQHKLIDDKVNLQKADLVQVVKYMLDGQLSDSFYSVFDTSLKEQIKGLEIFNKAQKRRLKYVN